MLIWKNTSIIDGYDNGLDYCNSEKNAHIAIMGSKSIELNKFKNLKAIFRAGVGKDNVPERAAHDRNIIIRYPSKQTTELLFNETAAFTCNLIFRMIYKNIGSLNPWAKKDRLELSKKKLLVIGNGNIGRKVAKLMDPFMHILKFDILENEVSELPQLISQADCITIHIPMVDNNISFMNRERLALMKEGALLINTARGSIVDEKALYKEISSKRIRAAFDVFWKEPYKGKLCNYHPDWFFMTPHIASTCIGFRKGCRKDLDSLIKELS